MTGVRIERLGKAFASRTGPVQALQDVTLQIGAGELLVVVGPSGSGKTTLLRVLAGLEEPSSGSIFMDGRNVNAVPPQDREVAMIFQDAPLYPHMTVRENLAFGLKLRKCAPPEREQRVREAAELLGLNALMDRLPKALSGGERQRVALGRAMVLRPRLLLLDEPLSNLDTPLRAALRQEVLALQQRSHSTMIYVTHDQAEALSLATRVAVLREGVLQQVATPEEVYRRPANLFVGGVIGWPPLNLLPGTLGGTKGHPSFQADPESGTRLSFALPAALLRGAPPGLPVVFGFRPEHLVVCGAGGPKADSLLAASASSPELSAIVLEAQVAGAEFHGSDRFVTFKVGATRWVARVPAEVPVQIGASVRVELHGSRGCLFDQATGRALKPAD